MATRDGDSREDDIGMSDGSVRLWIYQVRRVANGHSAPVAAPWATGFTGPAQGRGKQDLTGLSPFNWPQGFVTEQNCPVLTDVSRMLVLRLLSTSHLDEESRSFTPWSRERRQLSGSFSP